MEILLDRKFFEHFRGRRVFLPVNVFGVRVKIIGLENQKAVQGWTAFLFIPPALLGREKCKSRSRLNESGLANGARGGTRTPMRLGTGF